MESRSPNLFHLILTGSQGLGFSREFGNTFGSYSKNGNDYNVIGYTLAGAFAGIRESII